MKSVLLSGDIILDYLINGDRSCSDTVEVVSLCKSRRIKGWILEEAISAANKFCLQRMDSIDVTKRIKELLSFLSILPLNKESILRALSGSLDYVKVIQVEAARAARLHFLVVKDTSGYGEDKDIKIVTPKELVDEQANEDAYSIPALDLNRELHTFWDDVQRELTKVTFSTNFIMGESVRKFEERFAEYCKVEHCVAVASGSDALLISLMAIDVGPGDAVITTPYTFFATAGAISRLFALPVFVDIDSATYNIDSGKIEELIETSCNWDGENLWIELPKLKTSFWNPEYFPQRRRVKAIIPVHLFGQTADMEKIMRIARKYNLYVIEDAAQAHGAECWVRSNKGNEVSTIEAKHYSMSFDMTPERIGSIGHFGCFSVFPTKNLGCWGDGGAVTTNDRELAEKVRILRVHGSKPKYYHKYVGLNSRLDTMQATVLLAKLPYMDTWIEKRREAAGRYIALLSSKENISLPEVAGYAARHVWNQFVVRFDGNGKRDKVLKKLKDKSIGTGIYYPLPLHLQECFSYLGYKEGDFPNSEKAAKETLALPMFPEITSKEQEDISKKLEEILYE